jgi:hypothetical protein
VSELVKRPVFQCSSGEMSSSDEEAASPEHGACSSNDVFVTSLVSESSESDQEESPAKKKRGHVKDTRDWAGID